jgi:hypothetical protein
MDIFMYAETIKHRKSWEEVQPSEGLLLDYFDNGVTSLPTDDIDRAYLVVDAINSSVMFPAPRDYRTYGIETPVSLDEIEQRQIANCYGLTILTSECFERLNIDHSIAFSNGHAFIVKELDDCDVYMFDMPKSRMNGDISNQVFSRGIIGGNRTVLETTPGRFSGGDHSAFDRHPWLGINTARSRSDRQNRSMLISVFGASDGRQSIELYAKYCESVANGDYVVAADIVKAFATKGIYPEIDARTDDYQLKELVIGLICDENPTLALDIVTQHFSSLEAITGDARYFAKHGDLLRLIAVKTSALEIAYMAAEQYKIADERSKSQTSSWLDGRISKIAKLIADLKLGHTS